MKTCTTCRRSNPDTAVTCEHCGSPLDQYFGVPKTRLADPYKIDDLIEGDFITDKYRVVRTLGEGGMGLVYLVEEAELAEKYALKVIHPSLVANPEALLRFKDEVTISRRLHHPAIIRVFDFGKWVVDRKDEILYYFTMEYLKGKTLAKLLRERENSLPPFKPSDIRLVMAPLLDGLAYAHRFTIHRDIKPDNIMVSGEFPDVKVKILDFGIARTMGNSRLTRSRNGMGAAGYMAPEQMQDAHSVDRRADLYGVGMILYEMLTNKRAVGRFKLPSELLPPVYQPFDQVIETALASEPDDRYPDAQTMANALDTALDACEQQIMVREQAKQEEEERKKRLAVEEARKKALAEEEKRRKEEEKKQQERERRQKIKQLEAGLENAIGFARWEKAHGLCKAIQALDAINPLVRKELPRIERELERQEEERAREAARKKAEAEAEKRLAAEEARKKAQAEAEKRRQEEEKKQQDIKIPQVDPEEFIEAGASGNKKLFVALAVAVLIPVGYFTFFHKPGPVPIKEQEQAPVVIVPPVSESFATLTIIPEPADARIRILNIVPPYEPGMQLKPGRYHIEVSAKGYKTKTQWIVLGIQEERDLEIALIRNNMPVPGQTFTDPTTGMEFVFVKGGCFQMGDTFGEGNPDEKPVHEVCVDDFYMGKYEVTQGEWQKIMGNNPSHFKQRDNYPVETVSWNDAQEFIRKLNTKSHRKYRLPTEAEWEYAARSGGKREKYAGGNNIDVVAWYGKNSGGHTHEAGTKQTNGLGIYDMSGNVWEWCSDWYNSDYYKTSLRNNPQGPSSGSDRVFRGGGWNFNAWSARSAYRDGGTPDDRRYLGFRLALPPGQ